MKLSVKSDYAARAVLGLAHHHPTGKTVRIETLATERSIPANYLVQILIDLKAQGIVRSVRGKEGGYRLAVSPSDVSMGDVLRAVHGEVFDPPALSDSKCPDELKRAWSKIQEATCSTADEINFQQLVEESGEKEKMYYI